MDSYRQNTIRYEEETKHPATHRDGAFSSGLDPSRVAALRMTPKKKDEILPCDNLSSFVCRTEGPFFRLTLQADQAFRILRHGVIECEAGVSMRLRIQL